MKKPEKIHETAGSRRGRQRFPCLCAVTLLLFILLAIFASPARATSPGLAGGYGHSVALKSDGTVWAWGYNEQGQLGIPGLPETATPVQIPSLTGITGVASGEEHNIALKGDGTVWTWGGNSYGQLGTGGTSPSASPVRVPGLSGVVAVAAGTFHSIVLKSDGTVWGWGDNKASQLGASTNTYSPVQVAGISGVTAIATGSLQCVALKGDGSVWTWGYGPLGNGGFSQSKTPMKIPGLTRVVDIAVGGEHLVVLRSDGAVWTWGANGDGQLGDGSDTPNPTPTRVAALSGEFAAVAAGPSCSAAVRKDGTLWMWGANNWGQLGTGDLEQSFTPVQVPGEQGVVNLTLAERHSMSAHRDGAVWIWGANEFGQIGNGTNEYKVRPTQLAGLAPTSAVAAGSVHSMALHTDGTVSNWGFTVPGGLGDGERFSSYRPVRPTWLSGVKAIASGTLYSMALTDDTTITTWGFGPLGFEEYEPSGAPSRGPGKVFGLSGVTAIAAGNQHALALKTDGTVWAWGNDEYGQLGNDTYYNQGTYDQSLLPVQFGVSGVKAIAAGSRDSLALKEDGSLWASGVHKFGATPQSTLPVQLPGVIGVKAMAPGEYHTVVVNNDGTVWAWGSNDYGALGNGTTVSSATPVQVAGLSGVVAVEASIWFSYALKEDGTVWAWGRNNEGQLGNGDTNTSLVPVRVSGLTDVTDIASGENHALAVKKDGSVWAWGSNNWGELGINPGWSPMKASINLGAGQFTLSGTVHTGSTTGPVLSGATVAIAGRWASTDGAGAFSITGIPAGTYTLTISKSGYAPLFVPGYVVSGSESGLNFLLAPAPTYFVSGTVRKGSSTGPGLPAVKVAIAGKTVVTDAFGAFRITDIIPGAYTVSLYKFGYIKKSIPGFVVNGNKSGVTFYLVPVPTYSVSGTVRKVNSSGILLPGVSVTIAGKTVLTNSSGAFTITGIAAGTYPVYLYKSGYVTSMVSGLVVTGNKTGVALYLTPIPSYSLSGVLRSGSGTGPVIAAATVSIAGKAVTTSSTGTFYVRDIPGGTYSVIITKEGYVTSTITGFVMNSNRSGVTFVLNKQTGSAAKGRVREMGMRDGPAMRRGRRG